MFHVKKRTLLLIAGTVWLIAGFNVARLGAISYVTVQSPWVLRGLITVVFIVFGTMFFKMSQKHTKRILSYDEYRPFWQFFDLKAYATMAFMMGGGVGLRAAGVFPEFFIAFFYSGVGCALVLAGMLFFRNYILYNKLITQEITKSQR